MARPRRHKTPARLNITLDAEVKNAVMLLAAERGLSVGQLLSQMVIRETRPRLAQRSDNGHRMGASDTSVGQASRDLAVTL